MRPWFFSRRKVIQKNEKSGFNFNMIFSTFSWFFPCRKVYSVRSNISRTHSKSRRLMKKPKEKSSFGTYIREKYSKDFLYSANYRYHTCTGKSWHSHSTSQSRGSQVWWVISLKRVRKQIWIIIFKM